MTRVPWSSGAISSPGPRRSRSPLPKYQQAVVDSEFLYHGGYHHGPGTRYALITSVESGPASEQWIESQLP